MTKATTHHSNDNEELPFIALAAATANALRYLKLGEKDHREEDNERQRTAHDEQNRDGNREYVEKRLKDLARFERKASAGATRRPGRTFAPWG